MVIDCYAPLRSEDWLEAKHREISWRVARMEELSVHYAEDLCDPGYDDCSWWREYHRLNREVNNLILSYLGYGFGVDCQRSLHWDLYRSCASLDTEGLCGFLRERCYRLRDDIADILAKKGIPA